MEKYTKYGITLKPVELSDAKFILDLRTNESKSRFISDTDYNIEAQENWIKKYKIREDKNEEFYFIAEDTDGEDFATYRLYNLNLVDKTIEIGSFISKPNYPNAMNIIRLDILIKEFAFEVLKMDKIVFEVRKKNTSVVNYHKKFNPVITNEDDLNYYFELTQSNFIKSLERFQKLLK